MAVSFYDSCMLWKISGNDVMLNDLIQTYSTLKDKDEHNPSPYLSELTSISGLFFQKAHQKLRDSRIFVIFSEESNL